MSLLPENVKAVIVSYLHGQPSHGKLFRAAAFIHKCYRPEISFLYSQLDAECEVTSSLLSDAIYNVYNRSGMTPLEEALEIYVDSVTHIKINSLQFDNLIRRKHNEQTGRRRRKRKDI